MAIHVHLLVLLQEFKYYFNAQIGNILHINCS
jgi:hypothetical protein